MNKFQLKVKLLSEKLYIKVESMREAGLNPSALVRNFLEEYKLPTENKKAA